MLFLTQTNSWDNVLFAFLLTVIAGLSTGIGGVLSLFTNRKNTVFLSVSLGFSAGVMIYVSFVELFANAQLVLSNELGVKLGSWTAVISFFAGMAFIAIIDKVIPKSKNPHEVQHPEEQASENLVNRSSTKTHASNKLMRMGLFTALAIGIHNFPEGMATFLSALSDPTLAVGITVAIALHNIPEGISVYVPLYFATGNKKKSLWYTFLSGFAEPLGAIVGYAVLSPFINDVMLNSLLAAVAGIMVFISLDELLPAAREYGETHLSIYGLVGGMVLMAVSLLLFI